MRTNGSEGGIGVDREAIFDSEAKSLSREVYINNLINIIVYFLDCKITASWVGKLNSFLIYGIPSEWKRERGGGGNGEKITGKHSTNIWSMKFMAVARLNPQMNWIDMFELVAQCSV